MSDRENKIRTEAEGLWTAICGGAAPQMSGSDLLDLIVRGVDVTGYDRLYSPHLRPATITGAGRSR